MAAINLRLKKSNISFKESLKEADHEKALDWAKRDLEELLERYPDPFGRKASDFRIKLTRK